MDVDRATLFLACVVAWGRGLVFDEAWLLFVDDDRASLCLAWVVTCGFGLLWDEVELLSVSPLRPELPLEAPPERSGLWLLSERIVAFSLTPVESDPVPMESLSSCMAGCLAQ